MTTEDKQRLCDDVRNFRLPRYREIPTVGLYLEQTAKYISEYLAPIQDGCLTNSMVSNYVKKHLIASPERKQYSREQIAYLIFIAVIKSVISLDDLGPFIGLQQQTYPTERAYDYFCDEFENILLFVFGVKQECGPTGADATDEKQLLRSAIIAVTHKIYLEKCFALMAEKK